MRLGRAGSPLRTRMWRSVGAAAGAAHAARLRRALTMGKEFVPGFRDGICRAPVLG